MTVAENLYRETLLSWCEELETTWQAVREQLLENFGHLDIHQWEEELFSFKQSIEVEKGDLDENRLYERASNLYEGLNVFFEEAEMRQDGGRLQPIPIGGHRLPPLPYAYDALEPAISEEIMRLHHTKHHQSYVDGLNKAEKEMQKARDNNDFTLIKHWEREAAFHGSGHYLHIIFWEVMSPEGGGKPSGKLLTAINKSFGSFDKFQNHFSEAAKNVEAVGWAILVWAPRSQRLEILTSEKHQNLTQWDTIPLLVLDVWEHAYYLQYKNERAKYVENWWNVVNWKEVERRFSKASTLKWKPF
ncbi:superoxide dismutase [Bacillus sp. B15-48]|uniref:superoxide dismutase n=1 Tax=Bacillus sp. B15-48 TaxID=1548601 RepID=UPI00193F4EA8|nr:superoxide dismutase [Bacillus sp. B15-48]MBM4762839.1 superoxide dismutase [Bacillus sp. B15-48]